MVNAAMRQLTHVAHSLALTTLQKALKYNLKWSWKNLGQNPKPIQCGDSLLSHEKPLDLTKRKRVSNIHSFSPLNILQKVVLEVCRTYRFTPSQFSILEIIFIFLPFSPRTSLMSRTPWAFLMKDAKIMSTWRYTYKIVSDTKCSHNSMEFYFKCEWTGTFYARNWLRKRT